MNIKLLTNHYSELSYDELVKSSKESLEYIIPELLKLLNTKEDVSSVLIYFTSALLAADDTASSKEIKFLSDLLNMEEETIKTLFKMGLDNGLVSVVDHIFDSLSPAIKTHLLNYCLCFIVVDGNVDDKETTFIEKLISE